MKYRLMTWELTQLLLNNPYRLQQQLNGSLPFDPISDTKIFNVVLSKMIAGGEVSLADGYIICDTSSRRTKEWKDAATAAEESGRIPLLEKDVDICRGIIKSLSLSPIFGRLSPASNDVYGGSAVVVREHRGIPFHTTCTGVTPVAGVGDVPVIVRAVDSIDSAEAAFYRANWAASAGYTNFVYGNTGMVHVVVVEKREPYDSVTFYVDFHAADYHKLDTKIEYLKEVLAGNKTWTRHSIEKSVGVERGDLWKSMA